MENINVSLKWSNQLEVDMPANIGKWNSFPTFKIKMHICKILIS